MSSSLLIQKPPSAIDCINIQDCTIGDTVQTFGPFIIQHKLTNMQVHILRSLTDFYTDEMVNDVLLPLITQTSRVSLRTLDWLVTK